MPNFFHKYLNPEGELGVWKIEEEEAYFLSRLNLSSEEKGQLIDLGGRRKLEWLAVRNLIHEMSGRSVRGAVLKDEFGKPHLENSPWQISFSHSHELVAAIAAPIPVGIDIQFLVAKIERIEHKFLSVKELECLDEKNKIGHLHVFWGAKESLYKAYGRKRIDFIKNLIVEPFEYDLLNGKCHGKIELENFQADFDVFYKKLNDSMLVWVVAE